MRLNLSDLAIKNLKPPARGQQTYLDPTLPGFGLRISQGGTKTFTLMYGPDRQLKTIGRYPILTLAKARQRAKELLAEQTLGIAQTISILTFEEAFDLFKRTHTSQKQRESTAKETERLIGKHLIPKLRRRSIGEITTHDVMQLVDKLLPTPGTAIHVFWAARLIFRWAEKRRLISRSPLHGVEPPGKMEARERVLTNTELAIVYKKACAVRFTGGLIVQLLVITGQRRGEINALRAEYIDREARTITFPAELTKNGRTHTIPYGEMVAAVLTKAEGEGYLFPARATEGDRPYTGWSKLKTYLAADIAPWTLHDLRRTFATNLAALDIPPHVIERILNHASGTISGVGAIYNRHKYMDEMRDAMQRYEIWLEALLSNLEDTACLTATSRNSSLASASG